ncbi:MAG: hypothetical protein KatS3mg051_0187 [Anaerolineae bacterium]|nr:MAG: hypothetical protein KatS3mg051_0187 [Anaerolineae bacterium]
MQQPRKGCILAVRDYRIERVLEVSLFHGETGLTSTVESATILTHSLDMLGLLCGA